MADTLISPKAHAQILSAQRLELTEYQVYQWLTKRVRDPHNHEVLARIAREELGHYEFWERYSGKRPPAHTLLVWFYRICGTLLGLTFSIKLMERGEELAQINYSELTRKISEASRIMDEEHQHEQELIAMLDEERLRYIGSVVLGLSDALVELTGALAGLTLALGDTRLIAMIGLITGVAAALSMAASEYLSTKSEEGEGEGKTPLKAAVYTGIAYIFTVALLIAPFLTLTSPIMALALSLSAAILIILGFTFYISVARDLPFRRRFIEMAGLCLGVSTVSFGIGFVLRQFLGVDA